MGHGTVGYLFIDNPETGGEGFSIALNRLLTHVPQNYTLTPTLYLSLKQSLYLYPKPLSYKQVSIV